MTTAPLTFRGIVFHAAPERSPFARLIGLERLTDYVAAFKAGDLNVTAPVAARILRRHVIATGVICLALPLRGWKLVDWEAVDVGGDHDALLATVRHKQTSTIVTVLVINCMSYSAGSLRARTIMRAGMALDPDLIFATECVNFTGSVLPGAGQYAWWQPGDPRSAESSSLLACRTDVFRMTERRLRLGSAATPVGKINARSMVRARFTARG